MAADTVTKIPKSHGLGALCNAARAFKDGLDFAHFHQLASLGNQDYQQAMAWFLKAAAQGNREAISNVGEMHHLGHGVPVDFELALAWYHKAAELELPSAYHSIGTMYEAGQGVAQDLQAAQEWYRKAADLGFADAIDRQI